MWGIHHILKGEQMVLKESISGVRGVVGEGLTPEVLINYCGAFSATLSDGPIVVGRDSRPSGEAISRVVCGALQLAGRDVVDIGIQTTPTVELYTELIGAAGGVIVTASHNPAQWNALKFIEKGGLFLSVEGFARLLSKKEEAAKWARFDRIGKRETATDAAARHIDEILRLNWLDAAAIRDAHLRVVVDANGGTGGIVLLPLLEKLGCEVFPIACEPDGNFRHEPEPIPKNLASLEEAVKKHSADIGLATDPDADRLALVDESGHAIGEEYTLAIGAAEVLDFVPGAVVVNLSTSAMIEVLGAPVLRTPVGEINVSRKMLEIGSPVGGEGNGGLIVPECHAGRDGSLAAAVILHRMARTGKSLSKLAAEFPKLHIVKTKVASTAPLDETCYKRLIKKLAPKSVDTTDGIRMTVEGGWVHVRASNTEPVIRIIAEAQTEYDAEALIEKARSGIGSAIADEGPTSAG